MACALFSDSLLCGERLVGVSFFELIVVAGLLFVQRSLKARSIGARDARAFIAYSLNFCIRLDS